MDLELALCEAGYEVLGPAARVQDALDLVRSARPDAAVLDVNLFGQPVWPVAELLDAMGVPFLFCTGYARPEGPEPRLLDAPIMADPSPMPPDRGGGGPAHVSGNEPRTSPRADQGGRMKGKGQHRAGKIRLDQLWSSAGSPRRARGRRRWSWPAACSGARSGWTSRGCRCRQRCRSRCAAVDDHVSRGAHKLIAGLDAFAVDPRAWSASTSAPRPAASPTCCCGARRPGLRRRCRLRPARRAAAPGPARGRGPGSNARHLRRSRSRSRSTSWCATRASSR